MIEKLNSELHFVYLHTNYIVKGSLNSIIIDFQRQIYQIIPNDLREFILDVDKMKLGDILTKYINFNIEISEYILFLLEKEYAILTQAELVDSFVKPNSEFYFPGDLSNSVIYVNNEVVLQVETYQSIFVQLGNLGCLNFEIIFNVSEKIYFNGWLKLLHFLAAETDIDGIGILLNISNYTEVSNSLFEFLNHPIIRYINVFSEIDLEPIFKDKVIQTKLYYFGYLFNLSACGYVDKDIFSFNQQHFYESLSFNSCLNKKICIDQNFNIKNCLSSSNSFGNILNCNLSDIVRHKTYTYLGDITKDSIKVCKDCEFRYICTDCRAYVEDPADILSKPLKCGYNPYTGEWSEWSTNPLKQKAIEYYGMQDLVKERLEGISKKEVEEKA